MTDVWQQIFSSCSGALVTAIFMTPLDVVKIRLQAQTKGFVKGECFLYCNGLMDHVCTCLNGNPAVNSRPKLWSRVNNMQFTGMLDAFVKIPRVEGIRALWSGLPPTLVMAIPNTVIYFTTYDQFKYHLGYVDGKDNSPLIPFVCGAGARAGAVTVITPLELIRTKSQSEKMTYRQICESVKVSVSDGGIRSLWRGWSPLMWRDVPFSALYFTVYEFLKSKYMTLYEMNDFSTLNSFICGTIGGTVAGILTIPFDVVKTHRQIELGTKSMNSGASSYSSTYKMLWSLQQKHGFSSWFTGVGPRILKVAPACAIMISSYEYCKKLFSNKQSSVMLP